MNGSSAIILKVDIYVFIDVPYLPLDGHSLRPIRRTQEGRKKRPYDALPSLSALRSFTTFTMARSTGSRSILEAPTKPWTSVCFRM